MVTWSLYAVPDDVKRLVQKIGPEFASIFNQNNMKRDKVVAEKVKTDVLLQNGAGGRAKVN